MHKLTLLPLGAARTVHLPRHLARLRCRCSVVALHTLPPALEQARHDTPSSRNTGPSPPQGSVPVDHSDRPSHIPDSAEPNDTARQRTAVGVVDIGKVEETLRSWAANTTIAIRGRADQYTASAITSFAQLARELNKVTGYQEIETLKRAVTAQETRISVARVAAREAKIAYERAVQERAQSQREVNDLLQRKSSWTDDDVGRFTALVRRDHLLEQAENRAKQAAETTEDEVEREFTELMRVILNRYHEEQIWSDKIRSASTYGSLTVLGLNMFVFILAIVLIEPWKRKRLAHTFERKVEEMSSETIAAFEVKTHNLVELLQKQEHELSRLAEVVAHSLKPSTVAEQSALQREKVVVAEAPPLRETRNKKEQLWTVVVSACAAGGLGWLVGFYLSRTL
ncbi:Mdm33 family-domain-containing protein [Cytidiella melzeri]|nr:Mdm33 family-domain-containing protein [Cytidiella melzeri]